MLNAPRPRRPSLSTTQPAISDTSAPSSTSFRYSTSRPRFSTNPSRRPSNGFENDDLRNGSASGPSSSTHGSGSTWTEGQYPGPPLPARNPPLSNSASTTSGLNAILKNSSESPGAASAQGNLAESKPGTTPASSSVGSASRPSRSTNEAVTSHKGQGDAMDVDPTSADNGTNVNGRQEEEAANRTRSSRSNRRPLPARPHAPPVSPTFAMVNLSAQKETYFSLILFFILRWSKSPLGNQTSNLISLQMSRLTPAKPLMLNKATRPPLSVRVSRLDKILVDLERVC